MGILTSDRSDIVDEDLRGTRRDCQVVERELFAGVRLDFGDRWRE